MATKKVDPQTEAVRTEWRISCDKVTGAYRVEFWDGRIWLQCGPEFENEVQARGHLAELTQEWVEVERFPA